MSLSAAAPPRRKPPIRLILLLMILAVAIGITWHKYSLPEKQQFTWDFDQTIGNASPALGRAIAADPALHRIFLEAAWEAYGYGGWDAASTRVQQLKWQIVEPYASDSLVLACTVAQRSTMAGRACAVTAYTGKPRRMDVARWMSSDRPCEEAIADGAERRRRGETPVTLPEDAYLAASTQALSAPDPLTSAERDALADPFAPGAPTCPAFAKFLSNALERPDAAALFRTQAMRENDAGAIDAVNPVKKPPPESLCPRAGTVFTLSMQRTADGRPITWTTVRPQGWDCIFDSSATGRRDLWGDDFLNPLRHLWPLAVGKTATITTVDNQKNRETTLWRIESLQRYWLPIGWHTAYAISETVPANGDPRYVVTFYWSPELGFQIGQHTQVLRGDWPGQTAPDWQLIGMRAP